MLRKKALIEILCGFCSFSFLSVTLAWSLLHIPYHAHVEASSHVSGQWAEKLSKRSCSGERSVDSTSPPLEEQD